MKRKKKSLKYTLKLKEYSVILTTGGKPQINAKNSNFQIFESTLYMKSVSMPLRSTRVEGSEGRYYQRRTYMGGKAHMI